MRCFDHISCLFLLSHPFQMHRPLSDLSLSASVLLGLSICRCSRFFSLLVPSHPNKQAFACSLSMLGSYPWSVYMKVVFLSVINSWGEWYCYHQPWHRSCWNVLTDGRWQLELISRLVENTPLFYGPGYDVSCILSCLACMVAWRGTYAIIDDGPAPCNCCVCHNSLLEWSLPWNIRMACIPCHGQWMLPPWLLVNYQLIVLIICWVINSLLILR